MVGFNVRLTLKPLLTGCPQVKYRTSSQHFTNIIEAANICENHIIET